MDELHQADARAVDGDVTRMLLDWSSGKEQALDELMPVVFAELQSIARRHLGGAAKPGTLQPTVLVHEAYLRFLSTERLSFDSRKHFFAFASKVIRNILVDHARAKSAQRRGGDQPQHERLGDMLEPGREIDLDTVLAVDQALGRLAQTHPRQSRVAELRLFAGLSMAEIAEVVDRSLPTVERDWNLGRRRLARSLQ